MKPENILPPIVLRGIGPLMLATALFLLAQPAFAHGPGSKDGHDGGTAGAIGSGVYNSEDGADFQPPEPGTYKLPPVKRTSDGEVISHDGKAARLQPLLKGRISIVSFIYTSCDDVKGCPLATAKLFDLHDYSLRDPEIARNAQLVSLSFDPERDTPKVMESYGYAAIADEDAARKMRWSFLTTASKSKIQPILDDFGQVIDKRGTGSAISHLLRVYLIDREGRIRNIYGLGFLDQRLLIADIKTLLLEEKEHASMAVR